MASFCYSNNGDVIVLDFSCGGAPGQTRIDGKIWKRDIAAEHAPGRGQITGKWPIHSDAAGVGPGQVDEAMAEAKKLGVPTEYDRKTGCAIFTDRKHRKKFCRAHGLHDNDGGFGDA